jgi:hypothetical protein
MTEFGCESALFDFKHHVGFTSSIAAADRPELTKKLERLIEPTGFTGTLLTAQVVAPPKVRSPAWC